MNRLSLIKTTAARKDWQQLATCCLDISLYNRYQEGLYLASAYHWVSSRFDHAVINLGDTLHRHNLRHETACMEAAHEKARRLGDDWLRENEKYLKYLTIPYTILRSDDWLADPAFEPVHEELWAYYYGNRAFQAVVRGDVENFVTRRADLPAAQVREASLPYLIEETAADILLGSRGGVAHLYPGNRHDCYWHLIDNCETLPQILRGLENSAFKRLSPAKISLKPGQITAPAEKENRNAANG